MSDVSITSSNHKHLPLHAFDYSPREFEKYRPHKTANLSKKNVSALSGHIQSVCSLDDENAFILLLRFGFGVEYSVIRQLIHTEKRVQGICEAFRFACQQYLGIDTAISDKSMLMAFQLAMKEYDILLLNKNRGICWTRQTNISLDDEGIALREALFYARSNSFIQLDKKPPLLTNCASLDAYQTEKLAKYIQDLPVEFGSILMLHYYQKLEPSEIETHCDTKYARGKIEYFRRLFTQRFGLEYPISDKSFAEACDLIIKAMYII